MPKYRIAELSFIDNKLVQPDTVLELSGPVAKHCIPLDAEAEVVAKTSEVAQAAELKAKNQEGNAVNLIAAAIAGEVKQLVDAVQEQKSQGASSTDTSLL